MTLTHYCAQFDAAVTRLTRRLDLPRTAFPFPINLGYYWKIGIPAGAVAMMACLRAGYIK